ncbi:MAG TPA: TIM barrel protein, partial [Acidobacteriota bacterium]|nr:TIM barrel protein [Acidobacteriota bacterium]
ITLENIFPETYGAHPQELKNIILKGRKQMVADLMDKKIMGSHAFEKKEEAEAKAKEHIKATIDTGHLNIWRKNFIANPGETKEDTDKRFKEWAKGQLKSFVEDKADLVGNVHIADNLGYDDSHVTPGLGTAPVKEFLQMLKDKNYKHVVTSEGGFARGKSGQAGMRGVWAVAGNSLYSSGKSDVWTNPTRDNFYSSTDMYHTSIQKPNFMFRGYAPDNDDWKPWSGTGLE